MVKCRNSGPKAGERDTASGQRGLFTDRRGVLSIFGVEVLSLWRLAKLLGTGVGPKGID